MAQIAPQWQEISAFNKLAHKLISKYPDRFSGINADNIIAYGCINKERPENKAKLYDLKGSEEPESFTNSKKYFFKMFQKDWDERNEAGQAAIVFSALSRIDRENPESGKVGPLDYRDQNVMVRTFGADWYNNGKIANLMSDNIRIVDELNNF